MARAVVYDCAGTGEFLFCLPDVTGYDLAIGAPLPGFPELVVVELRIGSGSLPAYLRATHREFGAWCAIGVAARDAAPGRHR
jgi:hypothetical protein